MIVNELFRIFAEGTGTSGTGSSDTFKAAIVGGVAAVLAAAAPALFGLREREPKAVRELRMTERELREQIAEERDSALQRAVKAEGRCSDMEDEISRLREAMLANNLDPGPRRDL